MWLLLAVAGCAIGCGPPAEPPSASTRGTVQPSSSYRYVHLDVFTDQRLAGNQLAVFLEPEGLTADQMMAITREMSFSETTFVFPPEVEGTDARVRIFANNLGGEIEVAGHPTIGTVFALAEAGRIDPGRPEVVLGLGIGPTRIELDWQGEALQFAWMEQRQPSFEGEIDDLDAVAEALGLETSDIVSTGLPIQQVSCGAPFIMVPLASRAAVDRAQLDRAAMGELIDARGLVRRGVMVFSTEPADDGATAYSRMFGFGVVEDPATGNSSGPLGSYLVHYGIVSPEDAGHMRSRQGVAMGRPSWVHISVETEGETITRVRVGGGAVTVGSGSVRLGPGATPAV